MSSKADSGTIRYKKLSHFGIFQVDSGVESPKKLIAIYLLNMQSQPTLKPTLADNLIAQKHTIAYLIDIFTKFNNVSKT